MRASWVILLAPDALVGRWFVASAVYHEARHAEQDFLTMRLPQNQAEAAGSLPAASEAARQGMLAEGSPQYAAARGWWAARYVTDIPARRGLPHALACAGRRPHPCGDRLNPGPAPL